MLIFGCTDQRLGQRSGSPQAAGADSVAQHVVVGTLDRTQRRAAAGDERRDRKGISPGQRPRERRALVEQHSRARHLEGHQRPQLRAWPLEAPRSASGTPKRAQILGRQIDAPGGVILADVLPVLGQLQRAAHLVRQPHALRRGEAEDPQHELADRVGGQRAVAEQLLERLIAADELVAAVGLDQPPERIDLEPAGGDRRLQARDQRVVRLPAPDPLQVGLELVKQRQPVALSLVAGVVDQPGEAVHRQQVGPHTAGQEQARDGEVLVPSLGHHRGRVRRRQPACVRSAVTRRPSRQRPSAITGNTSR